ncbi:MAG: hypothetical protein JJU05_10740 [Verrucomicrobia bacterium]|nr:hypothetical protein [Verrucomicrobiota bacterium]MCH8528624.1 hypothetical protein [Kiritimatiellia bacterium]
MELKPQNLDGEEIAIFIWDYTEQSGGSAVLFGTARFSNGEFYVERDREPFRVTIPEEAWDTLRTVKDGDENFSPANVMVMLRLGPLPEDADESEYEEIDIPILEQTKNIA